MEDDVGKPHVGWVIGDRRSYCVDQAIRIMSQPITGAGYAQASMQVDKVLEAARKIEAYVEGREND